LDVAKWRRVPVPPIIPFDNGIPLGLGAKCGGASFPKWSAAVTSGEEETLADAVWFNPAVQHRA
jgi:hypothetical protein